MKTKPKKKFKVNEKAYAKIQQRRLQLLVHSYIYYILDDNIVSDAQWSKWAKELEQLQKKYPKTAKRVPYHSQFIDWDGSSGAFLQFDDKIVGTANYLLDMRDAKKKPVKKKKMEKPKKPVKAKGKKKRLF